MAPAMTKNRSAGSALPLSSHDIGAEIARLEELDLHELRVRWRKLFRKKAPPHLSRFLVHRVLAYRIQANAYGDLDRETVRFLDQVARRRRTGEKKAVPAVSGAPLGRLRPGTVLAREHDGVVHQVTVVEAGFAWSGTTYDSLSAVARAITGTNWNGPRFFGLRHRAKREESSAERAEARA